jgi:hypothetical protein
MIVDHLGFRSSVEGLSNTRDWGPKGVEAAWCEVVFEIAWAVVCDNDAVHSEFKTLVVSKCMNRKIPLW